MKHAKSLASLFISTTLISTMSFAGAMGDATQPYNWTGFYAGLNAGVLKNTMKITDNEATSFYATIEQASNPDITGGFQLGFRRQLNAAATSGVFGVEFSANFSDTSFSKQYGSPFANYQLESHNKLKNVSLLQLTGGIAADRTLLFLAAGLSWSNINGQIRRIDGLPFFDLLNVDKKAFGTAVGGGIEYAFTDKISVRAKVDVITPNVYTVSDNIDDHFQIANNIVEGTLGVNYRFG